MTYKETIEELESLKNERGIKYYKQTYGDSSNYLGLGLTPLRKIAKKVKIDHALAVKLSKSKYFEAKMLSIMVDDPQLYTKEKLEVYLKELPNRLSENPLSYFTMMLTEYIIAKSPDVLEVITKYAKSKKGVERFIAFSTLANLGRIGKADDEFFLKFLDQIENNIQKEENNVKDAMNNGLLYWGQRSRNLNSKVLKAFKTIGTVTVDYGETSCQTPDVPKSLKSERVKSKLK